jgi:lambda repressor-like predicted transcriptional regulator
MTVVEYFNAQLEERQMSLAQLSRDIDGELLPNMLSMIRRGKVKMPRERIPSIAKALGVDPFFMWRMATQEYEPEEWTAFHETFGEVLTKNEAEIIRWYRRQKK